MRQQELNWINIIHATHDQICSCEDTVEHLFQILAKDNKKQLSRKEIKQLKWHLTGDTAGDPKDGDAVDALDIGDLEALFSGEDVTEDDPSG